MPYSELVLSPDIIMGWGFTPKLSFTSSSQERRSS